MANKEDIQNLNTILSRRSFREIMTGRVGSISGNKIGMKFPKKGKVEYDLDRWANAQLLIKSGAKSGQTYHIDSSEIYKSGELYLHLTPIYDLTGLQAGDRVYVEWDISKLPRSYWEAGDDIVGSNFSTDIPGSKQIPDYFQGTFHRCLLLNQELPVGCSVENGDGIPSVNEHVIIAANKELYVVDKGSNYSTPIRPLHEDIFDRYGLSKNPIDITVTDEPLTRKAERGLRYAIENNLPTYEVEGQTLVNPKYEA